MLTLHNVKIEIQSFGSVWAIFLSGAKSDIEARYNSFWNWKGIFGERGELEWWHDGLGMFYTLPKRFEYAMQMAALQEILNTENTKGTNPIERAREIAKQRIAMIERVTIIRKQPEYAYDTCDFGSSITAEKGTGNFDDDVLSGVVNNNASHSGISDVTE